MSDPEIKVDRVLDFAGFVCDEIVAESDLAEMDAILLADQQSRNDYLDYCWMHVALKSQLHVHAAAQKAQQQIRMELGVSVPGELSAASNAASSPMPFGFLSTAYHGTTGIFSSGWPVAYLIATVIFTIAALIGSVIYVSHPVQVAQQSVPLPSPLSPLPSPLFTIRTPTALVTDLGTEFGVEVTPEGATDAQVFVGRVQVAAAGGQDGAKGQTETLQAGQYTYVGTNRIQAVGETDFEKRAQRFTRVMPKKADAADAYAKLVLAMNPVVYYRMEQWPKTDRESFYMLVDSAPGRHNGVAYRDTAFGPPGCQGKFGGGMSSRGPMCGDYAVVPDYPKAENGRLSASAWVWANSLGPWAGIAGNWFNTGEGSTPVVGQFSLGTENGALGVWILQQDNQHEFKIVNATPLPRCQWQHVAFVALARFCICIAMAWRSAPFPAVALAARSCPSGCASAAPWTATAHGFVRTIPCSGTGSSMSLPCSITRSPRTKYVSCTRARRPPQMERQINDDGQWSF